MKHIREVLFKSLIEFFKANPLENLIDPMKAATDSRLLITSHPEERAFVGNLIRKQWQNSCLKWPTEDGGILIGEMKISKLNAARQWVFHCKYFWDDPILQAWYDVLAMELDLRGVLQR